MVSDLHPRGIMHVKLYWSGHFHPYKAMMPAWLTIFSSIMFCAFCEHKV